MNERAPLTVVTLSIAAVERDTGLSKDTLRVWERRYGFPSPARDSVGERAYTLGQVEKLRIVKRLLDVGHRPGRIVPLAVEELQLLAGRTLDQPRAGMDAEMGAEEVRETLATIRGHDVSALRGRLGRLLARVGLARFVVEVVGPLNVAVGDAWLRGQMEIFEEHQYTETVLALLRQAIAGIPPPPLPAHPRVLLSTFPGEPHGLGLVMAEALLALEGCSCVSLGTQTPVWDIVLAARAYGAQVVGLTFTGCMSPNHIAEGLSELRTKLAASSGLWVGGSAPVLYRRPMPGVLAFPAIDMLPAAVQDWRRSDPGAIQRLVATSLECGA